MKNAIVIVNYNDYETTIRLVNNIIDYSILDLIVIVDNNSTDDSFNKLKEFGSKKISVIKTDLNKGYSGAINYGCDYIIKKYNNCNIAISNSDIKIKKEEDLKELFSYLKDDIVIVGPTIVQGDEMLRGWKLPTFKDDLISNLPFHRNYEKTHLYYPDSHYKEDVSYVDTVSGSFFLITSEFYKQMNRFDDNVFLYYEENILGKKAKAINKKAVVVNKIKIIHDHAKTIDKSFKKIKKYDMLKKSQCYYEKKYNNANIIKMFILKLSIFITRIGLMIKYIFE